MSDHTKIEWTEATWNPVTGCAKVSQGCKHCYADREWSRLAAPRPSPNIYTGRKFTDVACHPERLDQPLRWSRPRRIFVNSMSDLFHEAVPDDFIDQVFAAMALCPQHTFQVLTKRPERMERRLRGDDLEAYVMSCWGDEGPHLPWPLPNVWLGVSIEDQGAAEERIPLLLDTPAALRWVSAEPLLGPIDLRAIEHPNYTVLADCLGGLDSRGAGWGNTARPGPVLDWVVAGGESGPNARPMHPEWVRGLRDQCLAAGVPFLFKQWGEFLPADADDCDPGIETNRLFWSDGRPWSESDGQRGGVHPMARVGKKTAGRLLDGLLHDAYPRIWSDD